MSVVDWNCTVEGVERTIVHSFEVVHQRQDILMAH